MVKRRLGEMLVEDGVITEEQLQEALEMQKREGNMLGVILTKNGFIEDEVLLEYLKLQGTKVHV